MNDQTAWKFLLSQNAEKEHEKAPDFLGEAQIGASIYDVAAWFGEVSKGKSAGRPYLGLGLTSKSNSQKIQISLWEKQNRKSPEDPHFKTREQFNGQELRFAAWIEPDGELFRARVLIEPSNSGADDLSEEARETHSRLKEFVEQSQLRLATGGRRPPLPAASARPKPSLRDPDLDVAPDDIPFRSRICRDAKIWRGIPRGRL
jgi:hypothetical protein